jgi:hypothetical protein
MVSERSRSQKDKYCFLHLCKIDSQMHRNCIEQGFLGGGERGKWGVVYSNGYKISIVQEES